MRLRHTFPRVAALLCVLAHGAATLTAGSFTLSFTADGTSRWYDMIADAFGQLDKLGSGPGGGDGFFYATGYGETFHNPAGIENQFRPVGGGAVIFPQGANFANIGTLTWSDAGLTGSGVETAVITGLTLDFSPFVADNDSLTSSGYTTTLRDIVGTVKLFNGHVSSIDLESEITFTFNAFIWGLGAVSFTGDFSIEDDRFVLDVNDQDENSPFAGFSFWYGTPYPWARWDVTGSVRNLTPVVKTNQTITFAPLADRIQGSAPFPLSATATSGLPVAFTLVSGPATLSGNTLALTGLGTVTVRATQPGDDTYNAAPPVTRSFRVTAAVQPPVIASQPAALSVLVGKSATFTVTATSSVALSYQWRLDGKNISGATKASYTISKVSASHAGNYTVVVKNSAGSVTSKAAKLTVKTTEPPVVKTNQTITFAPLADRIQGSAPFTLSATATSGLPVAFTLVSGPATLSGNTLALTGLGTVTVRATQPGDDTYNAAPPVTRSFRVTAAVQPPVIASQPAALSVLVGKPATFTVTATSSVALSYQWRLDGKNISGATKASYTISKVSAAHAGSYTVVVKNSAGSVTSKAAKLTVRTTEKPAITKQPASLGVPVGKKATLSVTATGTPAPTFQWYLNGKALKGATKASYSVAKVAAAHAGNYTVTVKNSAGSVTSKAAKLTVQTPPRITRHPVQNVVARRAGAGPYTFTASASGSPAPTFQWYLNGKAIPGATSATYTITAITSAHAGAYTAVATNAAGSATTKAATLTVQAAPVITAQPKTATVGKGRTATLKVAAAGSGKLTYQWYLAGKPVKGATSAACTIARAAAAHAGAYTVVVKNPYGSVTSAKAVLKVE